MEKGKFRQFIKIRGANEHNLNNISMSIFQETSWLCLQGCPVRESLHWHSIPFMRKVSEDIWNPCLPMQDSSSDRWKNQM